MIEYSRKDGTVIISVQTSKSHKILAEFNCGSELYAKLLLSDLIQEQWRNLENIRREAYNQGYEDKKKRKPKADYFKSSW